MLPDRVTSIMQEIIADPDRVHIDVFKARDGRWTYCPTIVRYHPRMSLAFTMEGAFATKDQAVTAAKRDHTITQAATIHTDEE